MLSLGGCYSVTYYSYFFLLCFYRFFCDYRKKCGFVTTHKLTRHDYLHTLIHTPHTYKHTTHFSPIPHLPSSPLSLSPFPSPPPRICKIIRKRHYCCVGRECYYLFSFLYFWTVCSCQYYGVASIKVDFSFFFLLVLFLFLFLFSFSHTSPLLSSLPPLPLFPSSSRLPQISVTKDGDMGDPSSSFVDSTHPPTFSPSSSSYDDAVR